MSPVLRIAREHELSQQLYESVPESELDGASVSSRAPQEPEPFELRQAPPDGAYRDAGMDSELCLRRSMVPQQGLDDLDEDRPLARVERADGRLCPQVLDSIAEVASEDSPGARGEVEERVEVVAFAGVANALFGKWQDRERRSGFSRIV